jgi:hypothetical protein
MSDLRFRVLGEVINSADAFVDMELVGSDEFANLYFQRVDGTGDVVTVEPERLRKLAKNGEVIAESNIPAPNHQIWTTMETLAAIRGAAAVPESSKKELGQAVASMFRAAGKFDSQ